MRYRGSYKYILNTKIFSDNLHTENSYYLLGYLFADGCINLKKGSINITSKDKEILEKLSKIIGNIKVIPNTLGSYYIQWYSMEHIDNLISLGCVPTKSLILKFPNNLKYDLIHHFIRGYFDGDGSIGVYKHRNKGVLRLSIAGTLDFLEGINKVLNKSYKIRKHSKSSIYIMSLNGNKIVPEFCEILYNDATIYMIRKYKIFKGFIPYRYLIENEIK